MIYERFAAGSLILSEGDKSNNKFYVVLSGEVAILIRNAENVFISENLSRKFLSKLTKERLSQQFPENFAQFPSDSPKNRDFGEKPKSRDESLNENSKQTAKTSKETPVFRRNLTVQAGKIPAFSKKKHSLIVDIQTEKTRSSDVLSAISEDPCKEIPLTESPQLYHKETPAPQLPFFHLGKAVVLAKLREMGYIHKDLCKGEGFGEVALLDSKSRRTATVLSLTNVELIVILKKDFLLIRQKFSKEYKAKKKFLAEVLPFLQKISSSSTLDNLIFCFKESRVGHREIVAREGDFSAEKVWFLRRGRCKVEKKLRFLVEGVPISYNIHVCDVDCAAIIGEEVLFPRESTESTENPPFSYEYTVSVVSEEAEFYTVAKSAIASSFPKEIRSFLFENFLRKARTRAEIFAKCAEKVKQSAISPEIQPLITLKVEEKRKTLGHLSATLKENYYRKLKNSVAENFLRNGGAKVAKLLDFRSVKREIQEKTRENSRVCAEKAVIRLKTRESPAENSRELAQTLGNSQGNAFNFGEDAQNHRFAVFRRAKIANYAKKPYKIPHGRVFAHFSKKARGISRKSQAESDVLLTITANSFENTANVAKITGNCAETQGKIAKSQGNAGKAVRNLKVFLSNFKENNDFCFGNFKEKDFRFEKFKENGFRLHTSKESRDERASFSTRLREIQRIRSSLKRKPAISLNKSSFFNETTENLLKKP